MKKDLFIDETPTILFRKNEVSKDDIYWGNLDDYWNLLMDLEKISVYKSNCLFPLVFYDDNFPYREFPITLCKDIPEEKIDYGEWIEESEEEVIEEEEYIPKYYGNIDDWHYNED